MADAKISALTALLGADVADGDLFAIVDVSAGATKKITKTEASAALLGADTLSAALASLGLPQVATVTLTAADLAVLDTVPFELVPAPGVGKIIVPSSAPIYLSNPGDVGSLQSNNIAVEEGDGLGGHTILGTTTGSLLDATSAILIPTASGDKYALQSATPAFLTSGGGATNILGAIATSTINDGGTGYADNDTFTVDSGVGGLATGHVVSQVAGVVTAYALDTTPSGYLALTSVPTTATSGGGSGLLIDIDTLDYSANPMTLKVKILYTVMDVS